MPTPTPAELATFLRTVPATDPTQQLSAALLAALPLGALPHQDVTRTAVAEGGLNVTWRDHSVFVPVGASVEVLADRIVDLVEHGHAAGDVYPDLSQPVPALTRTVRTGSSIQVLGPFAFGFGATVTAAIDVDEPTLVEALTELWGLPTENYPQVVATSTATVVASVTAGGVVRLERLGDAPSDRSAADSRASHPSTGSSGTCRQEAVSDIPEPVVTVDDGDLGEILGCAASLFEQLGVPFIVELTSDGRWVVAGELDGFSVHAQIVKRPNGQWFCDNPAVVDDLGDHPVTVPALLEPIGFDVVDGATIVARTPWGSHVKVRRL